MEFTPPEWNIKLEEDFNQVVYCKHNIEFCDTEALKTKHNSSSSKNFSGSISTEHNKNNKTNLVSQNCTASDSYPRSYSSKRSQTIPPINKLEPLPIPSTSPSKKQLSSFKYSAKTMNSSHHSHHEHHDVHQQRLLWFFSFCNQRSGSSSSGSSNTSPRRSAGSSRKKSASSNRNKFAAQYQQQLQQQQKQSSNVFGCDLTEHARLFSDVDSIPHIVKSCTRFIEKHGIIFGIYRLSGMRVNIQKLRQDFDKNPKISMIESDAISNDAHAVACVLKQYFRELPIPLLTFQMYERFIDLFKHNNNSSNNITNINDICNTEPIGDEKKINPRHDSTCGNESESTSTNTTNQANPSTMAAKSKSSATQRSAKSLEDTVRRSQKQSQFTASASDSQLISLSSVVTTTTSDIKYQVKLDDLKRLLLQLPKPHYQTLKFLMKHLACIAANGQKTGMDSKNVAIVWAPNLLKPRELELSAGLETLQIIGLQAVITEQLIKHQKFLFDEIVVENDQISSSTEKVEEPQDDAELLDIDKIEDTENLHTLHNLNQLHQKPKQSEPMHNDQEQTPKDKQDNQDITERDENEENNF